ncbi:unnamed protein product [Musa banksii]
MTRTCHLLHGWERIVQCVRITRRCYLPLPQDVTGWVYICMLHGHYLQCFYTHKGQRGNGGGTLKCMGRLLELYDCLPPSFSPQRKRERGLQSRDADGMVSGGFGVGWGRRPHRRRRGGDAFVRPGVLQLADMSGDRRCYLAEIQH